MKEKITGDLKWIWKVIKCDLTEKQRFSLFHFLKSNVKKDQIENLDEKVSLIVTGYGAATLVILFYTQIYTLFSSNNELNIRGLYPGLVSIIVAGIIWTLYKYAKLKNRIDLRLAIYKLLILFTSMLVGGVLSIALIFYLSIAIMFLILITLGVAYLQVLFWLVVLYVFFISITLVYTEAWRRVQKIEQNQMDNLILRGRKRFFPLSDNVDYDEIRECLMMDLGTGFIKDVPWPSLAFIVFIFGLIGAIGFIENVIPLSEEFLYYHFIISSLIILTMMLILSLIFYYNKWLIASVEKYESFLARSELR
jgi:hypothetical protein